jgi:hypothetical protein
VTSVINRYYDPSTGQFLSIDPDVGATDQPYVFTNDDPLNAEDPSGLVPSAGLGETNAQVAAVAKAIATTKKVVAAARKSSSGSTLRSVGIAAGVVGNGASGVIAQNKADGESISTELSVGLSDATSDAIGALSDAAAVASGVIVIVQDAGDPIAYTAGQVVGTLGGGALGCVLGAGGGGFEGMEDTGDPFGAVPGAGIGCALGAGIGGSLGGRIVGPLAEDVWKSVGGWG